jgi:hypothetical protein
MATPFAGSGRRSRAAWSVAGLLLGLLITPQAAWPICAPIEPPQPHHPEFEPNDDPMMHQPIPPWPPLFGEMSPLGDSDCFLLEGWTPGFGLQVALQVDTFNPLLRLWGLGPQGLSLLMEVDNEPFCSGETLNLDYDPCLEIAPIDALVVEVAHSPLQPASQGNYSLEWQPVPSPVPLGDCCLYPIGVESLPYSDTRSSASPFRDQGFGSATDVWYRVVLDQAATLVAQTCGGSTNFDTVLRLVDDDCSTVLAYNDNSVACAGNPSHSYLLRALTAGTYYVVVEGASGASGTFTLQLGTVLDCLPVQPPDPYHAELEPNDSFFDAQPIPDWPPLYGEIVAGDEDWFLLETVPPDAGVEVSLELDFFDGCLELYGMSAGSPVLLASSDAGGVCELEGATVFWDPCQAIQPIDHYLAHVTATAMAEPVGHYALTTTIVASNVPVGDCCAYPVSVGGLPYTDTRATGAGSGYRDQGFNASPDVWYEVTLDAATAFAAKTCGGSTNFDTWLRIVDNDCATVLASNDNSFACGVGSSQSLVTACLSAGTYYVVVEGAGSASGTFTLNLYAVSAGLDARLTVGPWGPGAEVWHQRFTAAETVLWLRPNDHCGRIEQVRFYGAMAGDPWTPLGVDTDGEELLLLTTRGDFPDGDGWSLPFEPGQLALPDEPVEVLFLAAMDLDDGSSLEAVCSSTWSPGLDPAASRIELERYTVTPEETLWVPIAIDVPGAVNELLYELSLKEPVWQRDVPSEWQRPVSDTHCSPTAAAACLEWLDAEYGTNVTCGFSGETLITMLGIYCETNFWTDGTYVSDLVDGLEDWIDDCGGGYTVHSSSGNVADMQNQAEAQGQDVIASLRWSGGGGHSVTLSSVHNDPNPDGTITLDFMDPWTGETTWGDFNPNTGTFSGYGENSDSGSLGRTVYVCPVESAPGGGGGGGGGWAPQPGLAPLPLNVGRWWLKVTWIDGVGKAREDFFIVERLPAPPRIEIEFDSDSGLLRIDWEPVTGAVAYEVFRSGQPWFEVEGLVPHALVTEPPYEETAPAGAGEAFYRVRAVME